MQNSNAVVKKIYCKEIVTVRGLPYRLDTIPTAEKECDKCIGDEKE